jgi:hypothetical protein
MRMLLDAGADFEALDSEERHCTKALALLPLLFQPRFCTQTFRNTVLHDSVKRGRVSLTQMLLDAGADIEAKNHVRLEMNCVFVCQRAYQ